MAHWETMQREKRYREIENKRRREQDTPEQLQARLQAQVKAFGLRYHNNVLQIKVKDHWLGDEHWIDVPRE